MNLMVFSVIGMCKDYLMKVTIFICVISQSIIVNNKRKLNI